MSTNSPSYGQVDREYGMRLATTPPDEDGPVWMVNLMKYREVAQYADGRESTISGMAADDEYSPLDSLRAIGAAPVFFGTVDQQLLGDAPIWDRIGVSPSNCCSTVPKKTGLAPIARSESVGEYSSSASMPLIDDSRSSAYCATSRYFIRLTIQTGPSSSGGVVASRMPYSRSTWP